MQNDTRKDFDYCFYLSGVREITSELETKIFELFDSRATLSSRGEIVFVSFTDKETVELKIGDNGFVNTEEWSNAREQIRQETKNKLTEGGFYPIYTNIDWQPVEKVSYELSSATDLILEKLTTTNKIKGFHITEAVFDPGYGYEKDRSCMLYLGLNDGTILYIVSSEGSYYVYDSEVEARYNFPKFFMK